MALTDIQRRRYARHILLPELGTDGQGRLLASNVELASGEALVVAGNLVLDAGACAVATRYLERAGVTVSTPARLSSAGEECASALVERIAQHPALHEAARALLGAYAATEVQKSLLSLGTPGEMPQDFCLGSEEM